MTKYSDIRNIRVLAFLEAYEKQECLWNPALDSYKNKADRDGAYLQIVKDLNIPSLTVHDVKLKIKGIRTTYTKELRLLTKHRGQDRSYKPKLFWFNKANAFLKNVCVSRRKTKIILKEDVSQQEEYKDCSFGYISDSAGVEDVVENEANDEEILSTLETTSSHDATSNDSKTLVHVAQNEDIQDIAAPEQECFELPVAEIPAPSAKNEAPPAVACKDDEFDLFCRSVAAQMRSIPDAYSRSVAKLKIQQILFEAETGHYKNNPCITIPVVQQIKSV